MTMPVSYFDHLYDEAVDPWSLASRWYETRKYAVTVASLPRPRYRRAFEPGCSVGVLTSMLADVCDHLIASDIASAAVDATRNRVVGHDNVEVRQLSVPQEWPSGSFDLIVISELGYYLSMEALGELIDCAAGSLDADGTLVAVHWRHPVEDYPLSGDAVHAAVRRDERLQRLARHEEADFLLEVYGRAPVSSVAAMTGLVSR